MNRNWANPTPILPNPAVHLAVGGVAGTVLLVLETRFSGRLAGLRNPLQNDRFPLQNGCVKLENARSILKNAGSILKNASVIPLFGSAIVQGPSSILSEEAAIVKNEPTILQCQAAILHNEAAKRQGVARAGFTAESAESAERAKHGKGEPRRWGRGIGTANVRTFKNGQIDVSSPKTRMRRGWIHRRERGGRGEGGGER